MLPLALLAAAAALSALVLAGVPTASVQPPASGATRPDARALACPPARPGARLLQAVGAGTAPDWAPVATAPAVTVLRPDGAQPLGGLWEHDARAGTTAWGTCSPGAQSQVVQVLDPSHARVLLANPGSTDAVVDLSLTGPRGAVEAIGTSAIRVPAGGSRTVPLSVQAPAGQPVGARVVATEGRVAAWAVIDGPAGVDLAAAGPELPAQVLPAVPEGATSTVLVTNATPRRATVRLRAHGSHGTFEPTGAAELAVDPGTTTSVDVSRSFAGEAGSLSVESDQPVAAAVWSVLGKDLALVPGQAAAAQAAVLLPAGQPVLLTNPGASPVRLELRRGTRAAATARTLGPGTSTLLPASKGPGVLHQAADAPVAVAALEQQGGLAVLPGIPGGGGVAPPGLLEDPSLR